MGVAMVSEVTEELEVLLPVSFGTKILGTAVELGNRLGIVTLIFQRNESVSPSGLGTPLCPMMIGVERT